MSAISHPTGMRTNATGKQSPGKDHALENVEDVEVDDSHKDDGIDYSDLKVYTSLFCNDEPEHESQQVVVTAL